MMGGLAAGMQARPAYTRRAAATVVAAPIGGPALAEATPLVTLADIDAIREIVEARQPAFLSELRALVSIDCGTHTKAGVDEAGRRVATLLASLGGTVAVHPDATMGDSLTATFPGDPSRPRLLLLAHLDTVFDPGTAAARPFRVADGIATGPGVADMKAGLLAGVHALAAVRAVAPGALGDVVYLANADEEVGSPSSTGLIRSMAERSDIALVLECARASGAIVSSRKGTSDLRIRLTGRAAHAGVEPEKGRSAILAAAGLVTALHALPARYDAVSCNVGVIAGGTRPNVVAEQATLQVDVRAATGAELDAALAEIRGLASSLAVPDVTAEVVVASAWRPMEKSPAAARLALQARAIAAAMGFDLDDVATGGASDGNTTSGMGVPTLDGLGPIGGMDHSPEEYVEVASIVPRTTLLAALMLAISRDPAFAPGTRTGGGP
jgi:glutamate carboxypeptidase